VLTLPGSISSGLELSEDGHVELWVCSPGLRHGETVSWQMDGAGFQIVDGIY